MVLAAALFSGLADGQAERCGAAENKEETKSEVTDTEEQQEGEETEIQVFIAASLNTVMTELAEKYNEEHPEVKIVYNADSSGNFNDADCKKGMNVTCFSQRHRNRWIIGNRRTCWLREPEQMW